MDLVSPHHLISHLTSFTPTSSLHQYTPLNPKEANTLENRVGRSASIGALGGTQSLGTFSFKEPPTITGLPKSYSVSADGSPSYLTPTQMGRQELYKEVPFTAVFGLQRTERNISQAFANYAAEMGVSDQVGKLSEEEITVRRSRASMMDELD
jgi:hypothetical protein